MVDVYLPMMKAAAIISAGQLRPVRGAHPWAPHHPAAGQSHRGQRDRRGAPGRLPGGRGLPPTRTSGAVSNAPHTARWFTGKGGVDYTAGLLWTAESWSLMSNLTGAVRRGAPEKTLWESMQERPNWGPIFSSYMHAFAQHLGPDLLEKVPLPAGSQAAARPGRLARAALDGLLPEVPRAERRHRRSAQRADPDAGDPGRSAARLAHHPAAGQPARGRLGRGLRRGVLPLGGAQPDRRRQPRASSSTSRGCCGPAGCS